jgi:hypothetical protein
VTPGKRRDIVSALREKGFREQTRGRDHDYFFFEHEGLLEPVATKLSRGTGYREIGDGLIAKICRQLRLSRAEFDQLVACPLDRRGYEEILRTKGVIRPER